MRLIDCDTLKREITDSGEDCTIANYVRHVLRQTLDNVPTIDAVPVVRCRMCKHWTACETEDNDCYIYGVCNQIGRLTIFDWFCADGVREDDGNAR